MNTKEERWLLTLGGACAIAWPLLSELIFYALYPILTAGISTHLTGGQGDLLISLAEAGERPAVVALEWSKVGFQLLLLPFILALYRLLSRRGQKGLALLGFSLGVVSMVLALLSHSFSPTLSHLLGQAYVNAHSPEEGASIKAMLMAMMQWRAGLNQVVSLIYQACVMVFGLALIRSRIWRLWGWAGIAGALLALPAKIPMGLHAPTNLIWTGLAYFVWPVALGICLIRGWREVPGTGEESLPS